uniref:NFAT activating protein with ITAM motif 1 n=2 Tax=Pipistrellus kuhlii TaxID=59472 RepID=A0A7J7RD71_PIPKU|nr:NFAT activating protein with ITAM motif 1 [Pipistrellus kuhlii]
MRASWRQLAQRIPAAKIPPPKIPAPSTASPKQPPEESAYMALQRQDTEIYACMQSEAGSPPARRTFLSQENAQRCQSESEFNLVYENL